MIARTLASLVVAAAVVATAGCATNPTSIDAQWANPSAVGSRIGWSRDCARPA